jgi:hypothetical protein
MNNFATGPTPLIRMPAMFCCDGGVTGATKKVVLRALARAGATLVASHLSTR